MKIESHKRIIIAIRIILIFFPAFTNATIFTVTNTNNFGAGSYPQAIADANADASATIGTPHIIEFCTSGMINTGTYPQNYITINGPKDQSIHLNGNMYIASGGLAGKLATFNNIIFTGTSGSFGGGIMFGVAGTLNFNNCRFTNCVTTGHGGAVFNNGATMNFYGCTFDNNQTTDPNGWSGGAVHNNGGTVTFSNCTFSNNFTASANNTGVAGAGGGALMNNASGNMTVTNCTFFGNGSALQGGAIHNRSGATCSINNCLFVGNTAAVTGDLSATFTSTSGHNLIENTAGATIGGVTTGNITGVSAAVVLNTTLSYNGDYQYTYNLLPASPAIDAADLAIAPANDQRNFGRNGAVDIGAIEYNGTNPCAGFSTAINPVAPCYTNPFTLSTVNTGGSAPFVYRWMNGTQSNCTASPTNQGPGQHILTVKDNIGCVAKDTVLVIHPQASVTGNSNAIADGSATPSLINDTDFGTVAIGGSTVKTFTIQNSGTTSLTISSITLAAGGASKYTIGSLTPAGPISAGMSATFTVTFSPTAGGAVADVITIVNNGCTSSNYTFTIQGVGLIPQNALHFDGLGDHVTCGDIDLTSFTLEAWVNPTNPNSNFTIISKGNGNGLGENYMLQIQNNKLALYTYHTGFGGSWVVGLIPIPTNTWTHVAATYDNATKLAYLYVNGMQDLVNLRPNGNIFQDNNPTYLGRQGTSCNCNYFIGSMDEIRVWNFPRICADINATKGVGLIGNESGLVAYYDFNQGVPGGNNAGLITLNDIAGGDQNGTLSSFTLSGSASNWVTPGGNVAGFTPAPQPNIQVKGNGIVIANGDNTPDFGDFTEFGAIEVTASGSKTFVIENTGTGPLTVSSISFAGTNPGDFSVTSPISFPQIIGPGGNLNITITATPDGSYYRSAVANIMSDDCDMGTFSYIVRCDGQCHSPDYSVSATPLTLPCSGSTATVDIPNSLIGYDYYLKETSTSNYFGTPKAGTGGALSFPTDPIFSYTGYTIEVRKYVSTVLKCTRDLTFTTGVNVSSPEIEVLGRTSNGTNIPAGVSIANGSSPSFVDSTNFGVVSIGAPVTLMYIIQNTGSGPLNITGLNLSGPDASKFSISTLISPPMPLAAGFVASFSITYSPTIAATDNATITLLTDDCDESLFTFSLQGTGVVVPPGAALHFDGSNDYVSLNNASDFNFDINNEFSVEFWFKTSSAAQQVVFSKLTNAVPYNGYEVYMGAGKIQLMMSSNFGASNYLNMNTVNTFNDDTWHHAAVVYKGIADVNAIDIFVDGVKQSTSFTLNSLTNSINNANIPHIGARGNAGQSFYFNGSIDEVRVWNSALCIFEVASFLNCEKVGSEPNLVAYYNFNNGLAGLDNTGTTALTDIAGTDNTGILFGFTLNGASSNWITPGGVFTGTGCGLIAEAEIEVTGNAISISNNDVTPSLTDFTDMDTTFIGANGTKTFSIRNTGSAPLNLSGAPFVTITGSTAFSVLNQPASGTISPSGVENFIIQFTPVVAGLQTATITIANDDCSESLFTYTIQAFGAEPPEINVKQNATNILSGGTYAFGGVYMNENSGQIVFTIENLSANSNLTLTGVPRIKLLATANFQDFTLASSAVPQQIGPSSSAVFTVKFSPSVSGIRTAQISILNDDPDESVYVLNITGIGTLAGDVNLNGIIDVPGEIAGDTSKDGAINFPLEITGDVNGNGVISGKEKSGDTNGDGIINNGEIAGNTNGTGNIDGTEIAGDANGDGTIGGTEFTGDVNGNGTLDPGEILGDKNGDGIIGPGEELGDINGDGNTSSLESFVPNYIMFGQGTLVTDLVSRYEVTPALPTYYTYAWYFSDPSLLMIKDTTRAYMDVVANNQTNNGVLTCLIYKFGLPYDTLTFDININKNYINFKELAELTTACANVFNLTNMCDDNYIDYFRLNEIEYVNDGCVIGGLQDLTKSGITTTLEMGFTYTMELKPKKLFYNALGEISTLFYAVWIDYNNDGDFEDRYEYVKNGESNTELAKLLNITIANEEDFKGSRRLRVGMRSTGGFSSEEACSAVGESGEFEDYLVTLVPMQQLEGPNLLTPNQDGQNDILAIKGVIADKSKVLTVINKNGTVVYQDDNYNNEWAGLDQNKKLLPKGTYYYIFKNDKYEFKTFLEIDY